ncbi:MAG TPA: hypothetical protein VK455_03370 [Thermoplasmata archaeon]|nr:hypothetical protein [Thermoplasmata archaeon]
MNSRIRPQTGIAEYLKPEYSRMEVRAVEELIRRELELLPVRHSAAQRLLRWGRKRLREDKLPLAAGPALWTQNDELGAKGARDDRVLATGTLAVLPAIRGVPCPVEGGRPLAAAPIFARD